jgi:hypothetical protein
VRETLGLSEKKCLKQRGVYVQRYCDQSGPQEIEGKQGSPCVPSEVMEQENRKEWVRRVKDRAGDIR